ncbi:replication-associated protein [Sewage-associated circular DNA virus-18]|uniref:replication-associated protein n=1 Tax=Sewage-associated circular DNA virus-18 TaxID=1592085 RepID=UPI0005861265|nr:replication-associated protein [Sewage-associated circular DNA virus-18]AJD07529.1 replication-associated protein [Sewage-associated circular DNA virus-18]
MDTFPTPNQLILEEDLAEPETLEAPTEKATAKGFRLSGKNFTITFPQCDVKKEIAVERIEQKFGSEIKGYLVCEEQHKDGTPHLHVYLSFLNKKNFKCHHCFNFIGGKQGNYQVTKSVRDWVTYCTKGDNYVAKGLDVQAIKKKTAPKSTTVATMLMEGKSLSEINAVDPGYVMINKRKLEEYESWVTIERNKKSKLTWVPPLLDGLTDANKQICEWICSNIRQPRKFKAPQLFITGPKNLGKTSLIEWLGQYLSLYHIPQTEEFYDLYTDDYDLVVFDEFKGQKTIQWMNLFLQGSPMNIRKKGSQYMKMKNLPVIILSNYTLGDCYPKARDDGRLETLQARLDVIEVDSFIDFYKDRSDIL